MRSKLLQATVHLSLAALSIPRSTLLTKLPEILFEVLVVHWSVGLRLTLGLRRRRRWVRGQREMGFGLSSTTSAVRDTADQKINSEPMDV